MEASMVDRDYLQRFERELVDKGKLIEAGWVGLWLACIPLDAPQIQIEEMRNAFFAGAQHLFSCITDILEPDAEPTDKDIKRMDLIDQELRAFIRDFENRHLKTEGSA
jgi:hypothetical protein